MKDERLRESSLKFLTWLCHDVEHLSITVRTASNGSHFAFASLFWPHMTVSPWVYCPTSQGGILTCDYTDQAEERKRWRISMFPVRFSRCAIFGRASVEMMFVFSQCSGKGLGGCSALNFLDYTRPPKDEVDGMQIRQQRKLFVSAFDLSICFITVLEKLGNPGWNWKNFVKYAQRAEGFVEPSKEIQAKIGMSFEGTTLGKEGPVKISFPNTLLDINVAIQEVRSLLTISQFCVMIDISG